MYAMGLQITTVGPNDGNGLFAHFMIANGGAGHRHPGRQAAHRRPEGARGGDQVGRVHDELLQGRLRAAGGAELERRRRQQRLPREAVRDGSRRHAVDRAGDDQEQEGVLRGDGGDGPAEHATTASRCRAQVGAGGGFIPKGAKNVEVAKDFMKYFMQPQVMNENLKGGLGRWVPVDPADREGRSVVDRYQDRPAPAALCARKPCWARPSRPTTGSIRPGVRSTPSSSGAMAHADVIKNGMTPAAAVDKAFKRAEAIFAKYTFG